MLIVVKDQSGEISTITIELGSKYVISNDFDGDVFLNIDNDIHLTVSYSDDGVLFEGATDVSCSLIGKSDTLSDNTSYTPPILFSIYDHSIGICESEDEFEKLLNTEDDLDDIDDIDDIDELDFDEEEKKTTPDDTVKEGDDTKGSSKNTNGNLSRIKSVYNNIKNRFLKLPKMYRYIILSITSIIILLIIILPILIIVMHHSEKNDKNMKLALIGHSDKFFTIRKKIQDIITKLPDNYHIRLESGSLKGTFSLSGVVLSRKDIRFIHKRFIKYNKLIEYNIVIFRNIIDLVREILIKHNLDNMTIRFDKPSGRIRLFGVVHSMDLLYNAEIDISDTLSLDDINVDSVFLDSEVSKQLHNIVEQPEYVEKISLIENYANRICYIRGYLSNKELDQFNRELVLLKDKFAVALKIVEDIKDRSKLLPFKISVINTSSTPYIVTTNGVTLYPGGTYMGITLISITNNKIIFKGLITIAISLSDEFLTGAMK